MIPRGVNSRWYELEFLVKLMNFLLDSQLKLTARSIIPNQIRLCMVLTELIAEHVPIVFRFYMPTTLP